MELEPRGIAMNVDDFHMLRSHRNRLRREVFQSRTEVFEVVLTSKGPYVEATPLPEVEPFEQEDLADRIYSGGRE